MVLLLFEYKSRQLSGRRCPLPQDNIARRDACSLYYRRRRRLVKNARADRRYEHFPVCKTVLITFKFKYQYN